MFTCHAHGTLTFDAILPTTHMYRAFNFTRQSLMQKQAISRLSQNVPRLMLCTPLADWNVFATWHWPMRRPAVMHGMTKSL